MTFAIVFSLAALAWAVVLIVGAILRRRYYQLHPQEKRGPFNYGNRD